MDCIRFRFRRERYALSLEAVRAVTEMPHVRSVPRAPRGVLGLAESRGEIYTVLDLPWLLDESPGDAPPSLLTLAGAFAQCALFVPGPIQIGSGLERRESTGAAVSGLFLPLAVHFDGDGLHHLLSPVGIVAAARSGR